MGEKYDPYRTIYIPKRQEGLIGWLKAEAKRQERSVNAVIMRILLAAREGANEKEVDRIKSPPQAMSL